MHNDPIDQSKVPEQVRQIIAKLDDAGFETWLVGGCVRDLCLGLKPKDFDLATSARPEQVMQVFSHYYATGLQHGTITVIWRDLAVEITTFRTEGNYTDSRRPDLVVFHDQIEADLARRDFTMNSMAWRPDRGLLDMHGGLEDLRHKILRSVGNPEERFDEDALRLLRAIRFAVTYNMTPDQEMLTAADHLADRLDRLSRERVTAELLRILAAPHPKQLLSFSGCGLMSAVAGILMLQSVDDKLLCERLSNMIRSDLTLEQRLPLFYLASSAPDFSQAGLRQTLVPVFQTAAGHRLQHILMHECRISREMARTGEAMLYLVFLRVLFPLDSPLNMINQRRLLRLLARRSHLSAPELMPAAESANQLLRILSAYTNNHPIGDECLFDAVNTQAAPLTVADMALNGRLLQAAGWPNGPVMRIALERLLSRLILTPELNNLPALLALAKTLPRSGLEFPQKTKSK